jgi:hypothetical protein
MVTRERDALKRLHDWALAQQGDCLFSGDHPIAQAAAALGTDPGAPSDRELLELAAGATDHQWKWFGATFCIQVDEDVRRFAPWNPLADDGDALRLAMKLNITVFIYDDESSTALNGVVAKGWGSKEANTRRAIVMAAAATTPN